jgi:hypothetical protein
VVDSPPTKPSGSRIISRILPPAIRLWLATQLDHVEKLVFRLEGGDRTILSGHIPKVILSAEAAIYQGIHLSQAAVQATDIRINLGQVIRRKPLRLLAPFLVTGDVMLSTADLNASLQQAPLLGEGLYDFLQLMVRSQPEAADLENLLAQLPGPSIAPYYDAVAQISSDGIHLTLTPKAGQTLPALAIATQLSIKDGHRLSLDNPHWVIVGHPVDQIPLPELHQFEIDLGSKITLTDCSLQPDHLTLAGTLRVMP